MGYTIYYWWSRYGESILTRYFKTFLGDTLCIFSDHLTRCPLEQIPEVLLHNRMARKTY